MVMKIKFWGTRGSIPSPGSRFVRYGGNTLCVELNFDDIERLIIIDAGSGLRLLGLLREAVTHGSVHEGAKKRRDYDRLEFLGDRVLGLVVSDMLYRKLPKANEGELSRALALCSVRRLRPPWLRRAQG